MEKRELAEDATPEDREPAEDPTPEEGAQYKLFGLIPLKIAVPVIVVLPIVGYLVGMIGAGADETTVPVDFVISPQQASGALQPGATSQFTVLIDNPTDSGVRVASIGAGASEATAGCPAGTVTSKAVDDPPGYIRPNGVRAYRVTATMAPTAGDRCAGQEFTLPLTAELVSAG